MSGFESIVDQKQPIRLLKNILLNRTIPNALLFSGIDGIGKNTTAIAFAMACNCGGKESIFSPDAEATKANNGYSSDDHLSAADPCGHCRSCRKIQSGNHPDIIRVEPSGPFIRIKQIRDICDTLSLKPYEARLRIVIISDAQAMNPQAANALLKVLEEPPDRTVLILTALQPSDLLPTIVSRCQHIRFSPIHREELKTFLVEKHGLDAKDAAIFSAMANGSVAKALSMIRKNSQANWVCLRDWLLNIIGLEQVGSLSLQPIIILLSFAERLSKNKEIIQDSLEIIKTYLRDLIIYKYSPEKIINKDLIRKIQYASQKIAVKSLLSQIEAIQTAQKDIQANTNLRLTLEVMMLRLSRVEKFGI
ncbi:MAG: DNA polymerase III subunit delta' [Desulfobacteraceae bacterium]|nr:DNA polymerase III subunit delta' [Desulfobacteraceae bacterium]